MSVAPARRNCRLVLSSAPDAVVALRDIDQLKVHREGPYDPPELPRTHPLYPCPEPLVEPGVVLEAQPPAQQTDLLLRPEQPLALLLHDHLSQNAPE